MPENQPARTPRRWARSNRKGGRHRLGIHGRLHIGTPGRLRRNPQVRWRAAAHPLMAEQTARRQQRRASRQGVREDRLSGSPVGAQVRSYRSDQHLHRRPIAPAEYRARRGSRAHFKPQEHELSCAKAAISMVKPLAITDIKTSPIRRFSIEFLDACHLIVVSRRYWGRPHQRWVCRSSINCGGEVLPALTGARSFRWFGSRSIHYPICVNGLEPKAKMLTERAPMVLHSIWSCNGR